MSEETQALTIPCIERGLATIKGATDLTAEEQQLLILAEDAVKHVEAQVKQRSGT